VLLGGVLEHASDKRGTVRNQFFLSGEECSSPLHNCGIDFEAAWPKRCGYKNLEDNFLRPEQEIINKCFLRKVLDLNWSVIQWWLNKIFWNIPVEKTVEYYAVLFSVPYKYHNKNGSKESIEVGEKCWEGGGGRWPKGSGNIARHLDVYRASHEGTTTSWGVKITICFYVLLPYLNGQ
jgi:hypothetical protein